MFGINKLRRDEMPYFGAKRPVLGRLCCNQFWPALRRVSDRCIDKGALVNAVRSETLLRQPHLLNMAERVGFEPTVEFPLHSLSRRALSTAQTPLRGCCNRNRRLDCAAMYRRCRGYWLEGMRRQGFCARARFISAPRGEERLENGGAVLGKNARGDLNAMIEARAA